MKQCILISAFGTSTIEGYEGIFYPFIKNLEEEFKVDVFIGFTSERIIKKLKDSRIKSVEDRIKEIKNKGYEKIVLVKLILSDGKENKKIDLIIDKYKLDFKEIIKTNPILEYKNDFIDNCLKSDETTILISHGREDDIFDYISEDFKAVLNESYKNFRFLSLNKKDEAIDIIKNLKNENIIKVKFKPLLLTSGYHFKKDIYAVNGDSFKKRFLDEGIEVIDVNTGLLMDEEFKNFIIEKLRKFL
ncbi:MAG: sirohydrochlorin cobaltochelatase [Clostridium sp.]|uniref:sirohydrochlorin cobaltochelatase n=1 Tax=Clostridium sp. TaxID=1506 RepID=UPI003EE55032